MAEIRDDLVEAVTNAVESATDAKNFISPFGSSSGISVPLFSGGAADNFDKWIKHFDRAAQAARLTEERKCELLPLFLRDAAEAAYEEILQNERHVYETVKNRLHDKLQPVKLSDLASTILAHRKQLENEPVITYADTVQRLVKESYPELDAKAREIVLFRQFLNGLKPNLSDKVIGSNPTTFQEALAKARQYEAQDHFLRGTAPWLEQSLEKVVGNHPNGREWKSAKVSHVHSSVRTPSPQEEKISVSPTDLYNMELRFANMVNEKFNQLASQARDSGMRSNPNEQNRARAPFSSQRRPSEWTIDGRPICRYCGKPGHVQMVCMQRNTAYQRPYQNNRFSTGNNGFRGNRMFNNERSDRNWNNRQNMQRSGFQYDRNPRSVPPRQANSVSVAEQHKQGNDARDQEIARLTKLLEEKDQQNEILLRQQYPKFVGAVEGGNATPILHGQPHVGKSAGKASKLGKATASYSQTPPCSLPTRVCLAFLVLTCAVTLVTAHQIHEFQTLTYPNLGVAMVPSGVVLTSVDTKYLPVIIHVRPPPVDRVADGPEARIPLHHSIEKLPWVGRNLSTTTHQDPAKYKNNFVCLSTGYMTLSKLQRRSWTRPTGVY